MLMNGCDAGKSLSAVHMGTCSGISFSHAVAQRRLLLSDSGVGVAVAFHTIMLIDSAVEPVGTLSPLTQRHTVVLITAIPSLSSVIHSYNAADCSGVE